jgi:BASS family bile acid:Na+ symporter
MGAGSRQATLDIAPDACEARAPTPGDPPLTPQSIALKVQIVAMMVAVGLQLRPADLLLALRRPFRLLGMVAVNLVVFPALVWALMMWVGAPPGLAAGVLLCAAAPGGPTGPLFTRLAGGDLGFATAAMVVLGFLGLVTAPATVSLMLGSSGGEGLLGPMFTTLAVYQIAPLTAAMLVRRAAPDLARRLAVPAARLANLCLVAVILGLLVARGEALLSVGFGLQAALVGALLPWLAPVALAADAGGTLRAAGIVTAVRNLSIALLLSHSFFADPQTDVGILVWGFWMMVLPAALALWRRRRRADRHTAGPADGG